MNSRSGLLITYLKKINGSETFRYKVDLMYAIPEITKNLTISRLYSERNVETHIISTTVQSSGFAAQICPLNLSFVVVIGVVDEIF